MPSIAAVNVVMLLRGSDGAALNSNNQAFPLSVANAAASISELAVYPNPTRGQAMLGIDLKEATNLSISVMDATGRVVESPAQRNGDLVRLSTQSLASGNYQIEVSNGTMTATGRFVKE